MNCPNIAKSTIGMILKIPNLKSQIKFLVKYVVIINKLAKLNSQISNTDMEFVTIFTLIGFLVMNFTKLNLVNYVNFH